MGKPVVLVLVVVAVLAVLVFSDVIPLDLGGSGSGGSTGDLDDGIGSGEGLEEAGLEGRGTDVDSDAGDADVDVVPEVPAEVRGTRKGGAVIRGRVVFGESAAPAAGVTVRLVRPDAIFTYLRAEPKGRFDLLEAKTGRDGRFGFLDVTPSDKYVIRAQLEGYARVSSDRLDLRGNEQVDIGDLELGPAGSIAARVLTHEGKPAPNVRVAVTWMVDNPLGVILADIDTLPEIEVESKTDANGNVVIEALEPGDKTVVLVAPSGSSEVVRKVGVAADEETDLGDVTLSPNGFIAGRVEWADGTPIPDARVFAGPEQRAALRTVATKADGTFHLGWLPEGDHYMGIMVPDMPVELIYEASTGTDDLVVQFPVPGSMAGRVVQVDSGAPVTRFSLTATRTDLEGFQSRMVQGLILKALGPKPFESEDGSFELPRLSPGEYMLDVTAPGFPKVQKKKIVVAGGEATVDVVIEMPRGNIARGKVLRPDGSPASGTRLYASTQDVRQSGPDLAESVDDRDPDAVSEGDGSFALTPQAPGKIHIIAVHDTGLPTVLRDVNLKKGDVSGLEIVLPPSGAVEGVLYGEGGRPASSEEQVYVLYPDGFYHINWIDEDTGRFAFDRLRVGHCVIRWLSPRDHRNYEKVVGSSDEDAKRAAYDELRADGGEHYIADGETLNITLSLPRRVRFSGYLRVAGQAVDRGGIWVTIPEGSWGRWLSCDETGRFETEIQSGKYDVWIPDSEQVWTKDEIEIPDQTEWARDFDRP